MVESILSLGKEPGPPDWPNTLQSLRTSQTDKGIVEKEEKNSRETEWRTGSAESKED